MKKSILVLLLLSWTLCGFTQSTQKDETEIRKTLWNYLDGRNNGNPDQLRLAFHESAELRYMKKDSLYTIWPIKDYINGVRPGYKHNCKSRIVSIDILGTAAIAKIEIEYPNWKFADYINLLKMDDQWLIAVKTFSGQEITNNKRILFVITSHEKMGQTKYKTGLHLGELSHVYKPLYEKGYEIDFVSPKGGKTWMYGADMNDPVNLWFIQNSSAFYKFSNAYQPKDIDPSQYAAIYFVGGHGTMWDLPENEVLNDLTSQIYEQNGAVAGICHGSAGLVNVKLSNGDYLVDGKRITSFTDQEEKAAGQEDTVPFLLESKLKERGAIFVGAGNWENNVMVDGRIITGQNPASADDLAKELIKILEK